MNQKNCKICGQTFFRGKTSKAQFADRVVCGTRCAGAYRKTQHPRPLKEITENKDCVFCGKIFMRKRNIDQISWEKQRFCSKPCWYDFFRKQKETVS